MKYTSKAISLTYIRQGDSSIVSKVFTKEKGLQTFFVKSVRSKNSKRKLAYFEPLKLLNVEAVFNAKKSLQYLSEISIAKHFDRTPNRIYKNFIGFFIAEVSARVLQENEQNNSLFEFLWGVATSLYAYEKTDSNFSLKYLLALTKMLGFYPSSDEIQKPFFNLETGEFSNNQTASQNMLNAEKSTYLKALISNKKTNIPKNKKSELLKDIMCYYKLHHYNLDGVKSHLTIKRLRI